MKKDNKGFLLAESLIVSTFILTVLILLYIQFSNLVTNYKNSYSYNNVESIYNLSSMSNYLLENHIIVNDFLNENKPYVLISKNGNCNVEIGITDNFCDEISKNMNAKTIIYTASDLTDIKNYVLNTEDKDIGPKFRNFISRVETKTIQNKGRLFAEFNNETYATIALDVTPVLTITDLKGLVKNDGTDGLYEDKYESGRYIYRGANPNNYLTFNNETAGWRIVAIENDNTVKIVKEDSIGKMAFDETGRMGSNYCYYNSGGINIGCNAWSSSYELTTPGQFSFGNSNGMVYNNATINNYLNSTYKGLLNENNDKIVLHEFYIGGVPYNYNSSLSNQISLEKQYASRDYIGLISSSDYLKVNLDDEKCGKMSNFYSNRDSCYLNNYLTNGKYKQFYTITPTTSPDGYNYTTMIWTPMTMNNTDYAYWVYVNDKYDVRPALYLNNNIKLIGSGTKENPYKII